jgi:hypothetical protein
MDEPKRWEKGLAKMWAARRGSRKAQTGGAVRVKAGRPKTRRMVHEALHAALTGIVKA